MICVDSSVWIAWFNGIECRETALLDAMLGDRPVIIGDLILTEVLQGFRSDADCRKAMDAFATLFYAPMVGRHNALRAAENYRAVRARGVTVRKTIDVLIATFCIENGHDLLHADRDFDAMADHLGLKAL